MRKPRDARLTVSGFAVLSCVLLISWLLALPTTATALVPPPSKTPLPTATGSPTPEPPTDTPEPPTDTPEPPTDTPTSSPSDTPEAPTNTPRPPANTSAPPTKKPGSPYPTADSPPAPPQNTPRPDPNCQSVVEGDVADAAGQEVTGATVRIEGEGWFRAMYTDDNGHYGFGGLCAGPATVNATLPDGQILPSAAVSLDGEKHFQVDFGPQAAGAATATSTATQAAQTSQPTSTPSPSMPGTGYSGWLLVGGTLLGILLLLSAGVRRVFGVREQSRGQD